MKGERGHSTSEVAVMYPVIAHDKYVQNPMINPRISELNYSEPSRNMHWSTFLLLFSRYILHFHQAHSLPKSLAKIPGSAKESRRHAHSTQASAETAFFQALTALWKSGTQTPTLRKRHSYNDPKHSQRMCTNTPHRYWMGKYGLQLPLHPES